MQGVCLHCPSSHKLLMAQNRGRLGHGLTILPLFRHIFTLLRVCHFPLSPRKTQKNQQLPYVQSRGAAIVSVMWALEFLQSAHWRCADVKYLQAVMYKLQHCKAVNPDKSWVFEKNLLLFFHCMVFLIIVLSLNIFCFSQQSYSFRFRLFVLEEVPIFDLSWTGQKKIGAFIVSMWRGFYFMFY